MNRLPQFRATVEGAQLQFVHQQSAASDAIPLLLIPGYPDSFWRFSKIIPQLNHRSEGGLSFHVVAPSLPGYAFSEPRTGGGGAFGYGDVLHRLMTETLGYKQYLVHGGDWGSSIGEQIGRSHSGAVLGLHLTEVPFWHSFQKPSDLTYAEEKYLGKLEEFQKKRMGRTR